MNRTPTRLLTILLALLWSGRLGAWTNEWRSIEHDARELLTGREFRQARFGMEVDGAKDLGETVRIDTTGTVFTFDKKARAISVQQRLPKPRPAVTLSFGGGSTWEGLTIVDRDTGAAWLATEGDQLLARVNCDSLLMFASTEPTTLTVQLAFEPTSFVSFADRYLFLDNYGGVGLYPLTLRTFDIGSEIEMVTPITDRRKCCVAPDGRVSYRLAANEVFWVSVAPPKPYNWHKLPSQGRNFAFHSWFEGRAPSDEEIGRWAKFCNVLLLQSPDGSLYHQRKDWRPPGTGAMTDTLTPIDSAEFTRVVTTAHARGMKVVVNAGAMYFRAELPKEKTAQGESRFVRGPAARNFPGLYAAVKRLREEHPIDGAYFDELYPANTVRAYLAARRMRELFGDEGVMIEHHDMNFHSVTCPPATLCWHDAQIAGEALARYYNHRDWLRYACSTYNIANCNDYVCNNFRCYFRLTGEQQHMDDALVQKCLDYNIFQFYAAWWSTVRFHRAYCPRHFRPFWERYSKLMQGLDTQRQRERVEAVCRRENAQPRSRWKTFLDGLSASDERVPTETLSFNSPLSVKGRRGIPTRSELGHGWSAFLGPKSDGRMEATEGKLHIAAKANTCAYIERALPAGVKAIECRMKTGSGNGMTYGPRLGLRWTDGDPHELKKGYHPHFQMSLTQRGTLAARHERSAGAHVEGFPVGEWHTLRYRFVEGYVIGEIQRSDGSWRPIQIMLAPSSPISAVVGKTGDLNRAADLGGRAAHCWVDQVRLF